MVFTALWLKLALETGVETDHATSIQQSPLMADIAAYDAAISLGAHYSNHMPCNDISAVYGDFFFIYTLAFSQPTSSELMSATEQCKPRRTYCLRGAV